MRPFNLTSANELQRRGLEVDAEVAHQLRPRRSVAAEQILEAHGVDTLAVAFIRGDQARQTDEQVVAVHRRAPWLPRLDHRRDGAQRVAPEENEATLGKQLDDLLGDQAVRRRLVEEAAGSVAGRGTVEPEREVVQRAFVLLAPAGQLIAEVLDRFDHSRMQILGVDAVAAQRVSVGEQQPRL